MTLLIIGALIPVLLAIGALTVPARRPLLYALAFLIVLNGVNIPVGSLSARADQVVGGFLAIGLVLSALGGQRRLYLDQSVIWLALFGALNVLSSALFSPVKAYSMAQIVSMGSTWAIYIAIPNALSTVEESEQFILAIVWAAIVENVFATCCFLLALTGLDVYGARSGDPSDLSVTFGAYGTMREPNILGSFALGALVLGIGLLWLSPPHVARKRRSTLRLLVVTSALALLVSFTRGAWVGAVFALLLLPFFAAFVLRRRVHIARLLFGIGGVGAVFTLALVIPGPVSEFLKYKLENIVNPQSDTAQYRLITFAFAWKQILNHPILGNGSYTFAPLAVEGADFRRIGARDLWIGNFELLALHDTGIIGLIAFLGFLAAVLIPGIRAAKQLRHGYPTAAATTLSLTAGMLGMLVAFQSTTGFPFGYPWMWLGMIAAYTRASKALSRRSARQRVAAAAPRPVPAAPVPQPTTS